MFSRLLTAVGVIFVLTGTANTQEIYKREPPYMSIFGLRGVDTLEVEPGLYTYRHGGFRNIFMVTSDGVIATDPINPTAAAAMREEIAKVTDQPVKGTSKNTRHLVPERCRIGVTFFCGREALVVG